MNIKSSFSNIPVVSKAAFEGEFDFCNAGDLLKNNNHARHIFYPLPSHEGVDVKIYYDNGIESGISLSDSSYVIEDMTSIPSAIQGYNNALQCVLMNGKVYPLFDETIYQPIPSFNNLVSQLQWFERRGVVFNHRVVSPATNYQLGVWAEVRFLARGHDHRALNATQRDWVTMNHHEFEFRRAKLGRDVHAMQATANNMLEEPGVGAVLIMTSSTGAHRGFHPDPAKSSAVIVTK